VSIYLPGVSGDGSRDAHGEGSEVVLIVEDEPDLMDVAAALFNSMGYEVATASSAQEAMSVLADQEIDILFTDIVMPNGMNGIELAGYTREVYPHIQIILASGYPLPALKLDPGAVSDYVFVNKPYRLADLARALRTAS
jgi:CheY-like chemotaxis protein